MATREEILRIDSQTPLIFKDETAKKNWQSLSLHNINYAVFQQSMRFAHRWATLMQSLMSTEKRTLEEVVRRAATDCNFDNITYPQYLHATQMLCEYWVHGNELKSWHNEMYGGKAGASSIACPVNPIVL